MFVHGKNNLTKLIKVWHWNYSSLSLVSDTDTNSARVASSSS